MDAISEAKLVDLHPKLADLIRQMYAMLEQENYELHVVQGLRSWSQQDVLYQQGRTTLGPIVTEAQAGYSWHNFGLAVDVAPFVGLAPDWNASHPAWQRIFAIGKSLGLVEGACWHKPDDPHLQLSDYPVTPTDEDREIFLQAGESAVWDKYGLTV
jgi:peptidoglycan L-alanyl-D-glutamate endopeptidase CwlK